MRKQTYGTRQIRQLLQGYGWQAMPHFPSLDTLTKPATETAEIPPGPDLHGVGLYTTYHQPEEILYNIWTN